jgi:Polyketide cyclase / dehydrase and lipid transport
MTRIHTAIHIRKPITEVFTHVTTPCNWPQWHPASLAVSGATDHSLECGEQVTEDFQVGGRRGQALWTVTECEAPRRWVIEGHTARGGRATIVYRFQESEKGTLFERELRYSRPGLWFRLSDMLVGRRRMRAQSAKALQRLKNALEASR